LRAKNRSPTDHNDSLACGEDREQHDDRESVASRRRHLLIVELDHHDVDSGDGLEHRYVDDNKLAGAYALTSGYPLEKVFPWLVCGKTFAVRASRW
jgi:hypothetical protein